MRSHLLVFALACNGAACDGTPVDPLERIVPVPAGQAASASIGTAAGFVELVSSNGARFRLEVPAGALDSTTIIGISTNEASRSQRFLVRFAPEGLAFREPATISVELPPDYAIAPTGTLTYNSVPLAVDRLVGGGLRASVRRFARMDHLRADMKGAQPEMAHTSPAPPPCAGWSDDDTFVRGGLVAADEVTMNMYGFCAYLNISDLMATAEYADVVQLADATDAFLQRAAQAETGVWFAQLHEYSCFALTHVIGREPEPPADMYGRLHWRLGRNLFLARHVRRLGGTCAALGTYPAAVDVAAGALVAYYASREGAITSIAAVEYASAVEDAVAGVDLLLELSMLDASEDLMAHASRAVREIAHPALLKVVLPAAVNACGQTGNTTALVRLRNIMGPLPALQSAIQNCVAN